MKNKDKLLQNNSDTLIYKNSNKIRFKRINRRLKDGWIVFALSTLSMVSVGFSTWAITGTASGYGQVDVIADDVADINRWFYYDYSPSIDDFGPEGFIDSTPTEGYIKMPFQIRIDNSSIIDHLPNNTSSLTFSASLINVNSSINFFDYVSISEATLEYSNDESSYNKSFSKGVISKESKDKTNSYQWDHEFLIDSFPYLNEAFVAFQIKYKITFTITDFNTNIFNKLDEDQTLNFSFKVGLVF